MSDTSHSRRKRFISASKTALKNLAEIMAAGSHEDDAIIISDDEEEIPATNHQKLR
jgi:hypothetical protein